MSVEATFLERNRLRVYLQRMAVGLRLGLVGLVGLVGFVGFVGFVAGTLPMHSSYAAGWLEDPLNTQPLILQMDKTLPGEAQARVCPAANAAISEQAPLTLERAFTIALCHNPQLQTAWAGIKVQAAAVGEAQASYWPTLNATVSRANDRTSFPNSTISPTDVDMHSSSATLSWRLLDFGGRAANARASKVLLDAALSNHDAALQKTWGAVVTAYFDARTAEATFQAQARHQTLAQESLLATQRKEARGAAAQTDTLQAATAVAKATLEYSRAKAAQYKASSALLYALGLPAQTVLKLNPRAEDVADTAVGDLSTWMERTRQTHPAILAARLQRKSAEEKAQAAQSEGRPTLDVSMGYYENGRPNQSLSTTKSQETLTSLTLNIPVFAGFANTYKYQNALAQVEQAAAQSQDVENQTLAEVGKAHSDVLAAQNNLSAAQALLNAAQAAMQSVQHKFDRGAADRSEMLSTESALVDAQSEQLNARLALSAATLKLFATAGQLSLNVLR